jgi:hypothetical protein
MVADCTNAKAVCAAWCIGNMSDFYSSGISAKSNEILQTVSWYVLSNSHLPYDGCWVILKNRKTLLF